MKVYQVFFCHCFAKYYYIQCW